MFTQAELDAWEKSFNLHCICTICSEPLSLSDTDVAHRQCIDEYCESP